MACTAALFHDRMLWTAISAAVATVALVLAAVPALAGGCTAAKADAAATAADDLRNWPDILSFYREYRSCDDGGTADATTDAVMRLLARQWGDLATLARIARQNPGFKAFVLSHVDSTADTKDLERAQYQSLQRCPHDLHSLCANIAAAAKEAMK